MEEERKRGEKGRGRDSYEGEMEEIYGGGWFEGGRPWNGTSVGFGHSRADERRT